MPARAFLPFDLLKKTVAVFLSNDCRSLIVFADVFLQPVSLSDSRGGPSFSYSDGAGGPATI